MIISKLTIGMLSSREGSWKASNLSNLSNWFWYHPIHHHPWSSLQIISDNYQRNHFMSVFSIQQVRLSQNPSGSSSKMVIFITRLRMSFAFFPLAGAPELWGCWLTLQDIFQLSLCSVFPHLWSSRKKWSQSIEGQLSVLLFTMT